MNQKAFHFFFVIQLVVASFALAQSNPKALIPRDPAVKTGILPNGMRYYIRQHPKPEHRAELRLVVRAGSLQEDADQLGIAHFVEHLAFNGTTHFPKGELVNYLESVGTRFGADLNAYTSFDETVYMIQARTDSAALLQKGLLILEDWASGIKFDSAEIDKERGVVISEWRSRLSPDQRLQQQYFPILYQNSRYAERLPIGKPEIIETIDYEAIKRFYRDWYRPDLMAIVVVGDVDVHAMELEIIQRFTKIRQKSYPRKRVQYTVPGHPKTLYGIFKDKEAAFTTAQVVYKHKAQALQTIQDYKAYLTRLLYNRMLNARLYELQQQPNPPFTFASSGYSSDIGDMDTYRVDVFTAEGKAMDGLRAICIETRRALLHGFTPTELERQKIELLQSAESNYREKDKLQSAQLAARFVYHFLENMPIPDAEQLYELYQELLPQISLQDINPLAKQWITKENRVVIVTGHDKENMPLPDSQALQQLLDEIDQSQPSPFVDQVNDMPLMPEKLSTTPITHTKVFEEVAVTEIQLANGVKVVLKPTNFKNDEILVNAYSPGGHSLCSDADYYNAANAALMVDLGGIARFNAVELQKKLTGKRLNISPYITELYEGFSGYCSPDDAETLFQLVYLFFTQPRGDSIALQSFITRQESILQNMMVNPYYYFNEERNKIKYNNHPRRRMDKVENLQTLSLDKAMQIYKDRFSDASDFTFVLVGAFDVEKVKPLLATYLGNLPATGRKETWKDIGANLVTGSIDTTIMRGQAPKALVELTFHGDFDYAKARERYCFSALLDLLRIKLRESLREDKGGVYGVSVAGVTNQFPKQTYRITISFNCEPSQTDSLIQSALAEIEEIKASGAAEKDLEKIKEIQKQSRIKSLQENSFWSGTLLARYQNNVPLEGILFESYEKMVNSLQSKDIQAAANRYFDDKNRIKLVLLPE